MSDYFYPQVHPEKADGDVFLGNVSMNEYDRSELERFKTLRLGNVAYTIRGTELDSYLKPLFINASEYGAYMVYINELYG